MFWDKRINDEIYYPFLKIKDMDYNFPLKIYLGKSDHLTALVHHPIERKSSIVLGDSKESVKRLNSLKPQEEFKLTYTTNEGLIGIIRANQDLLFRIIGEDFIPRSRGFIKFVSSQEGLITKPTKD